MRRAFRQIFLVNIRKLLIQVVLYVRPNVHGGELGVACVRTNPVGEEDIAQLMHRIHPEKGAGETAMPIAFR